MSIQARMDLTERRAARGKTTDGKDVLDWCRDKVAGYKRPRSVSFIAESEMPRTATGKIQHRVLRERFGKRNA